ncbi:MAG: ester cyclase [Bacteroidota bacterium]|nr:ester cyclase [Bacteroidota bacterium]
MENNKLNVLRQVVEKGFGNADLYIIDQLINDNLVEHQPNLKGGKEAVKKAILNLDKAFSNRLYQLAHYSVNGDIVWVHYKFTAIHTGPYMGHEPTGKDVSADVMDIARIENGQIMEHWGIPDIFSIMKQIGVFKPTPSKAE